MTGGYVLTYDNIGSASAIPELVVQKVHRPFVGGVRDTYVEVPGRESAWLFTEEPGDATLTMDCTLIGSSAAARRASVRALAAYTSKRGRKALIINDEPDRLWWAKLASPPDPDEAINFGRLTLEWRVQPYAEAVATSSFSATATLGVPQNFNAPGDGIARMVPVIEVTTLSPAASGVAFTLNGVSASITEVLAAGVTRTFSTVSATVTEGANGIAELASNSYAGVLNMSTFVGDFARLEPGGNVLTATRGAFSVVVRWRRRYS